MIATIEIKQNKTPTTIEIVNGTVENPTIASIAYTKSLKIFHLLLPAFRYFITYPFCFKTYKTENSFTITIIFF